MNNSHKMDKEILSIIDNKAARDYCKFTPIKKAAYRIMLYAGALVAVRGVHLKDVATETGYSVSSISKFVTRWSQLMTEGNVTVNLIAEAVRRLPLPQPKTMPVDADVEVEKQSNPVGALPDSLRRYTKRLGFQFSRADEAMIRGAIRSSILFMEEYGKGSQPRTKGEYYAPGTNPADIITKPEKWLPIEMAALYCGCNEEHIIQAAKRGEIIRRQYNKSKGRTYYEYFVTDLDSFIKTELQPSE